MFVLLNNSIQKAEKLVQSLFVYLNIYFKSLTSVIKNELNYLNGILLTINCSDIFIRLLFLDEGN